VGAVGTHGRWHGFVKGGGRSLPADTLATVSMAREEDRAMPRVGIGLAVYNGEEFLAQAIESILGQTFEDFNLLISDNASTDGTAAIAKRYAATDSRVTYSRNDANIGGARNENLTVELTSGEYFRWAAHDDYLEPELLAKCVTVLDRDPDVVVCYTQVRQVDVELGTDQVISRNNADSPRPGTRFRKVLLSREFLEETYGLMRRGVLEQTELQADYVASDRTLMAELSLYGRFHEVPEPLFVKRLHAKNRYVDWRTRIAWFRPDATGAVSFPWWAQFADLWRTIRRARVSPAVKAECVLGIVLWTLQRSPNLAKDLAVGLYALARGRRWRLERYQASVNWE
jgi:glycosyltransferase involved in cell wall biosynthesis